MTFVRHNNTSKQYKDLVDCSRKLHRDISDLETAYLLHNRFVDEDENSVRGLIRKEVGGSRWAHGGEGKLTTYKSSKDLIDRGHNASDGKKTRSRHAQKALINGTQEGGDGRAGDISLGGVNLDDKDQISDLKTKVLKKASAKLIRRETWSISPNTSKENKQADSTDKISRQERRASLQHAKPRRERTKETKAKKETLEETTDRKDIVPAERKSRLDVYNENTPRKVPVKESPSELKESSRDIGVTCTPRKVSLSLSQETENSNVNGILPAGVTYTPRKFQKHSTNEVQCTQHTPIFYTQAPEPSEIVIDPKSGQVRVTAGTDDVLGYTSSLEGTRVLIQPRSVHNSVESSRLTCSVVENGAGEHRLVRGFLDEDDFIKENVRTGSSKGPDTPDRYISSGSPSLAAKQCNSEVEFWLRSLGIPDIDKYVRIFAENEIDLTDLEFMSAAQLHDMGVTAFGASDKILKGIRDLKNPAVNATDKTFFRNSGVLQSSSIAWEEVDENRRGKLRDNKLRASNNFKESCHNETSLKHSRELPVYSVSDRKLLRSNSARSDVSESVDSAQYTERSETPSFAASTKSSSAKCVEKRPPSAKNTNVGKNSKPANQSQNKTSVQSTAKLKRSNSSALEKPGYRGKHLEAKPTKGVLIRPRSASLTRDAPRKVQVHSELQSKDVSKPVRELVDGKTDAEDNKKLRQLRARSRSADVVKRKALEGVQAAAKKFEERHLKQIEGEKTFNVHDERMKLRRDEMAARHLEREKVREKTVLEPDSSDDDSYPQKPATPEGARGLESLVTVNILSPPTQSDPRVAPSDHRGRSKERKSETPARPVAKPRESLVKVSGTSVQPAPTLPDVDLPMLSTYKIGSRDRDKSHSEPESGYKTDGSTTYSQIEEKVSDIQLKIKRLKAQASTGDEMTLTLVHDLQQQLARLEEQLKKPELSHQSDPESSRVTPFLESSRESRSDRSARKNSDTDKSPSRGAHSPNRDAALRDEFSTVGAGVRMSKQELLKEMRKEKQEHHRQIRQLQSELMRVRHVDAVSSMEINQNDISYRQEDLIGEGTFSRVFKGEYQGSEVAMKQLKLPLQQRDKNYFAAEVSLLKELRHPRVVLLIGVCTSSKLPVMVLEYMARGSLYNYLHDAEIESLDHALYYQISRDIALGMNYLHSHKPEVLHLDLKSMNVLLCQSLRAKIADFGFSKLRLDAGMKSDKKRKLKSGVSAPMWMSPELLDKGEVTGKSDVYSFGIILWEMLTRQLPYTECSVFQVLEMVRKNKRPEIPDGTPEGLAHLIKLCWDPNPAKRPQFKDVLQILENLAFPPAWRELFKKAGVPDSALQDVQSTRTIISLVTGTLDSGRTGILHSFMVAQTKTGNQLGRKSNVETGNQSGRKSNVESGNQSGRKSNMETGNQSGRKSNLKTGNRSGRKSKVEQTSAFKSEKGSSRSSRKQNSGEKSDTSSRHSKDTEDLWDSETVTSISDKVSSDGSELTLKNLTVASSEGSSGSDLSSDLSSDDESCVLESSDRKPVPKTKLNVFVPSLELSIQSVREELKAERQRISQGSDWTTISLDDRTDRTERNHGQGNSLVKGENSSEMKLRLSSSLSNRTPSPAIDESASLNESARNRRRNKAKDVYLYSEDYLRRESCDNRRPPSPKKKTVLGQADSDNPGRPSVVRSSTSSAGFPDRSARGGLKNGTSESFVEKSYDSFFDLSQKKTGSTPNIENSDSDRNVQINSGDNDDVDLLSTNEMTLKKSDSVRRSLNKEPTGRKSISSQDKICVEDMENEVLAEELSDWHKTGVKIVNTVDEVNSSPEQKIREFVNKPTTVSIVKPAVKYDMPRKIDTKADIDIAASSTGLQNEEKLSKLTKISSAVPLKGSNEKLASGRESMSVTENSLQEMNEKLAAGRKSMSVTENSLQKTDKRIERVHCKEKVSLASTNGTNKVSLPTTNEKQKVSLSSTNGTVERDVIHDNVRVTLNDMLTSQTVDIGNADYLKLSLDKKNKPDMGIKSVMEPRRVNSDYSKSDSFEQIRVKLDLNEVEEKKKKPSVTPRRSLQHIKGSFKSEDSDLAAVNKNLKGERGIQAERTDASVKFPSRATELEKAKNQMQNNQTRHSSEEPRVQSRAKMVRDSGSMPTLRDSQNRVDERPLTSAASTTDASALNSQKGSRNTKTESIPSPKKNTIRVKLRKDPLAAQAGPQGASPVPPPPPPPPLEISKSISLMSRSVQDQASRSSMADELKNKLASRQSISEGMLQAEKTGGRPSLGISGIRKQPLRPGSKSMLVPGPKSAGDRLVQISEMDERLAPQQSEGLPSFMVQSVELQGQKDQLRSISKPHPNQIDDLSNASQEQLSSIAEILKKAVLGRRLALGEDGDSVSQSLESTATGWSIDA